MGPVLGTMYDALARRPARVGAAYESAWGAGSDGGRDPDAAALGAALATALGRARSDDVRRGVSTVGPHRDELALTIGAAPARTQARQGEQRSLALALRLAVHDVVTAATGTPPVLLLDDVFSELDPDRSAALLAHLPPGQTLLTTAVGPAPGRPARPGAAPRGRRDPGVEPARHPVVPSAVAAAWLTVAMAWRPLPGASPPPVRLGDTIDRVLGRLGTPPRAGVEVVFERWSEVVGEAMAARTRPVAIDGETLVVACDDPALTTHVRFLETAARRPPRRARRRAPRPSHRGPRRPSSVGARARPGAPRRAADRGRPPWPGTSHPSGRLALL